MPPWKLFREKRKAVEAKIILWMPELHCVIQIFTFGILTVC